MLEFPVIDSSVANGFSFASNCCSHPPLPSLRTERLLASICNAANKEPFDISIDRLIGSIDTWGERQLDETDQQQLGRSDKIEPASVLKSNSWITFRVGVLSRCGSDVTDHLNNKPDTTRESLRAVENPLEIKSSFNEFRIFQCVCVFVWEGGGRKGERGGGYAAD